MVWLSTAAAANLEALPLLGPKYPRVFFFRAAEGAARRPTTEFAAWDAGFSRLLGIMGKVLDEEVPGTQARNPDFFTRFKQRHPEQAVLLHFNGNACDPRFAGDRFFPGHWIYRRAVTLTADVPAEPGETVIHVADASDFQVNTGRYRTSNDDLALFGLTPEGRHDWAHCEQVQLLAIDRRAKTIRVKRGCYGTRPLAFQAGRARAAAHQVEGPWGGHGHLLWYYNHATHCPRDARGKSCDDVLIEELAGWFGPGGVLAAFDGIEFDVLFHETRGDTDGDGTADQGRPEGRNAYGIGTARFIRRLRERLGAKRLILADGGAGPGGSRSQRAWPWLNGIETEGWPTMQDWEFADWSGGLNRLNFWRDNSAAPRLTYINHKWHEPIPDRPGARRTPKLPFGRHRLVFAAAAFANAAVCCSLLPPGGTTTTPAVWDEFWRGTDHVLGWLGRPIGPARHWNADTQLLLGATQPADFAALTNRLRGAVRTRVTSAGLELATRSPDANRLSFDLTDIPANGRHLRVFARVQAEPRRGYPLTMARLLEVGVSGGVTALLEPRPFRTGMILRGRAPEPLDPTTGASVRYLAQRKLGGRSLPCYAVHPPYKQVPGAVFWEREVEPTADTVLRFALGMGEKSPERSDGVSFQVWLTDLAPPTGVTARPERLFEETTNLATWQPRSIPLGRWAGRRVRLRFVADCGPRDNTTTDHAHWGDVRLVRGGKDGGAGAMTRPEFHASWANPRPFDALFTFRDVATKQVNLHFRVEGNEPFVLSRLEVRSGPPAMFRVFERGVVLANAGLAPVQFDLEEIVPNRRYRRLSGSPGQDPVTNNGEPVGRFVTLGPLDALFLARVDQP